MGAVRREYSKQKQKKLLTALLFFTQILNNRMKGSSKEKNTYIFFRDICATGSFPSSVNEKKTPQGLIDLKNEDFLI